MSVFVKGMEMPECCRDCELSWCEFSNDSVLTRSESCPMVDIPDKHGNLIDAGKAVDKLIDYSSKASGTLMKMFFQQSIALIMDQPTVIEKE